MENEGENSFDNIPQWHVNIFIKTAGGALRARKYIHCWNTDC
jgi:hypothetical protein